LDALPQNDVYLMLQVKGGSIPAFAELHGRYQEKLLGYFFGLSGSSATANDLTQETFLRVWQVRKRYRATGTFPGYLFAIARLIWQEHQRRESKVWRLGSATPFEEATLAAPSLASSPGRCAEREELQERLLGALAQLPEEQRQVFLMRHVRGLSLQDIAEAMDCPVNTVRSRKILAIKKLRHLLAPYVEANARTGGEGVVS